MPARGTQLYTARFERCSLRNANLSYSDLCDMELEDCVLDRACFVSSNMDRSRLYRCRFVEADLRITRLRMTDIVGSDFSRALLDRADFKSAILKETSFRGAFIYDATLDDAYVGCCDLRDADMSYTSMPNLCTTSGAWFFRCDLRGVKLGGRRLKDARFTECRFYGVQGQPIIEGTCAIERPNMAPDDEGEDIRGPEEVLRMWGQ
jgi:uncharacterized protein YjbI with pentapeptide repeats